MGSMDSDPESPPVRLLAAVDVAGVAEALDDSDWEAKWWYDPSTGQVEMGLSERIAADFDEDDDPMERGLVSIDSLGSREAYADMTDFADAVGDRRAADLLQRALPGRGAFRRFRDTLHEFPDLLDHWLTYSRACAEMRAIDWLEAEAYVEEADAEAERGIRSATCLAVLAAVGAARGIRVDVGEITARWADVERTLDDGHDVTLLRDGRPWATITPE